MIGFSDSCERQPLTGTNSVYSKIGDFLIETSQDDEAASHQQAYLASVNVLQSQIRDEYEEKVMIPAQTLWNEALDLTEAQAPTYFDITSVRDKIPSGRLSPAFVLGTPRYQVRVGWQYQSLHSTPEGDAIVTTEYAFNKLIEADPEAYMKDKRWFQKASELLQAVTILYDNPNASTQELVLENLQGQKELLGAASQLSWKHGNYVLRTDLEQRLINTLIADRSSFTGQVTIALPGGDHEKLLIPPTHIVAPSVEYRDDTLVLSPDVAGEVANRIRQDSSSSSEFPGVDKINDYIRGSLDWTVPADQVLLGEINSAALSGQQVRKERTRITWQTES
jgi:hypothetical protein